MIYGNKSSHPFLIINITKKNIFAIQCASVKEDDNKSYFSRNDIKYYELKYFDIDYVTHVNLESFENLDNSDIQKVISMPNWKDYDRVTKELLS